MSAPVASMIDLSVAITTRPRHDDRNLVSTEPLGEQPHGVATNATNSVGPTQPAQIQNVDHNNVSRAQRLHELRDLGPGAEKTRLRLVRKLRGLRLLKNVRGYTKLLPPIYIPAAFIHVVSERSRDVRIARPKNWPSIYLKKMTRVLEFASGGTDSFWPEMSKAVEARVEKEGVGSPEEVLAKDLDIVVKLLRERRRAQRTA